MGKNVIRLTESQLHKLIKESVKGVLNESVGMERKYWSAKEIKDLARMGDNADPYDKWAVKASSWGSARFQNYNETQKMFCDVVYENGKYYALTRYGKEEVPFNYSKVNSDFIESGNTFEE